MGITARLRFGERVSARQPRYDLGGDVTAWVEFRDSETNALTAVSGVAMAVTKADGITLTPALTPAFEAVGIYSVIWTPDQPGLWAIEASATTSGATNDRRELLIVADALPPAIIPPTAVLTVNGNPGPSVTLDASGIGGITSHSGLRLMDLVPVSERANVLSGATAINPYLSAAIEAVIALGGGKVILPISQNLTMNDDYSRVGITVPLTIEGAGSMLTRIKWGAGSDPGGGMFVLRGAEYVGALSVEWPQSSTVSDAEFPVGFLSVAAEPGTRVITLSSVTGLSVGMLIRLKAQRLWSQDPRNSIFYGELAKIKAIVGNTVELFRATTFGYTSGVLHTGTAQAGTTTTITLAAGTSFDFTRIIGCRIRIVSGVGAGQQRYITGWDDVTKVATIDTVSTYPQLPLSPAPDSTSVYEIDSNCYVLAGTPAPALTLRGFTLDGNNIVNRASTLDWTDRQVYDDVSVENFLLAGFYSFRAYEPHWNNVACRNVPGVTSSLGYGTSFQESRAIIVENLRAYNCRRATDALGSFPSVGAEIGPFFVSQGEFTGDGSLWSADRRPTGVGSHSQAYEWHWHHGHIENVASGIIARGVKCRFSNSVVSGDVSEAAFILWSTDFVMDNIRMLGRSGSGISPADTSLRYGRRHLAYIANGSCRGTLTIRNCAADELPSAAVYLGNSVDLPITNVRARIVGNEFDYVSDSNVFLLAGENVPDPTEWEFVGNINRVTGGGAYVGANLRGNATITAWNKIGHNSWQVKILDDEAVSVPVSSARQDQVMVAAHSISAFSGPYFFGILREVSATVVLDVATPSGMARAVPPFTGTTNADGSSYIGFGLERLWIENRSGATLLLTVSLIGGAG